MPGTSGGEGMKLLPLVIHAGLQIPRWTSRFSDALAVSSIDVVSGGAVTINCASAHGVPVGQAIALSITDAEVPNPITAAVVQGNGDILVTTQYAHNLSASPDPDRFKAYSEFVKTSGFSSGLINGIRDLIDTPSPTTFVLRPGGEVLSITLTGSEVLLDRLDFEVTGWHKVTATTTTALTFPAPATVTRDYSVASPSVVRNIRVQGAVDHEAAVAQYVEAGDLTDTTQAQMFILPHQVRTRGKFSLTDPSPGDYYLQTVDDGFTVLIFLPSAAASAHVPSIDLAQGEIFKAILRTFAGLKILRSEFCAPGKYVAVFESHMGASHSTNRAIYAHEYVFKAPFMIGNDDALGPLESTILDDIELGNGTVPTSIYPEGSGPFDTLDVTGIYHQGHPSPLEGEYEMETA